MATREDAASRDVFSAAGALVSDHRLTGPAQLHPQRLRSGERPQSELVVTISILEVMKSNYINVKLS